VGVGEANFNKTGGFPRRFHLNTTSRVDSSANRVHLALERVDRN